MSSFRVQLDEPVVGRDVSASRPVFDSFSEPKRRSKRPFVIAAAILILIIAIAGVVGFLYYQGLKQTPQYSLALLIDAAKRDDRPGVDSLIDTGAVAEDFMPQITDKAIELYGRGQPPKVIARVAKLSAPLMPAVKDRAKAELPRLIRERTAKYGDVPFFAMVIAANRYLDITVTGDTAVVKSKMLDHPLEMKMKRNGSRWQITGVRDEPLATDIARKIGQEIMAMAENGPGNEVDKLGVGNLSDLLRQAEELVR